MHIIPKPSENISQALQFHDDFPFAAHSSLRYMFSISVTGSLVVPFDSVQLISKEFRCPPGAEDTFSSEVQPCPPGLVLFRSGKKGLSQTYQWAIGSQVIDV